jgi:hypothetical protein
VTNGWLSRLELVCAGAWGSLGTVPAASMRAHAYAALCCCCRRHLVPAATLLMWHVHVAQCAFPPLAFPSCRRSLAWSSTCLMSATGVGVPVGGLARGDSTVLTDWRQREVCVLSL